MVKKNNNNNKRYNKQIMLLWCAWGIMLLLIIIVAFPLLKNAIFQDNVSTTCDGNESSLFNNYITAEGNLLSIVSVFISLVVIAVPIIINLFIRNSNEEWFKKKIEEAGDKMEEEISKRMGFLEEQFKNVEQSKKDTELFAVIVEQKEALVNAQKNNFEKFIINHELEKEYNNKTLKMLEIIEIIHGGESKRKYLEEEINSSNNYPACGFYELGKIYLDKGDYSIAAEKFQIATEKNPEYLEAYRSLAESLITQSEIDNTGKGSTYLQEAWKAIEIALSIDRTDSGMINLRDKVLSQIGMTEEKKDEEIDFLGIKIKMVSVKGGAFTMGNDSNEADPDEQPVHRVLLDDYYISETVVTQEMWEAVMGEPPVYESQKNNHCTQNGKKRPVTNISMYDVHRFLNKINNDTKNNRPKGYVFHLPTEAQWEYAARGGNKSNNFKYGGSNDINEVAVYWKNSGDKPLVGSDGDWNSEALRNNHCETRQVKTKKGNELKLFDMSGNVWEWCEDMYGTYKSEPQINPKGDKGRQYVVRGGGWYNVSKCCRVTHRMKFNPQSRLSFIGIRLVLSREH